ncbi:MAG TPA: AarF/ABC1/UbiB kinase family protein, partial [Bdellovibrio sp.]
KRLSLIAVGFLFISRFASAMVPDSMGLYLSFEQRVALSYALLAQGESEQKKVEIINRGRSYLLRMAAAGVQNIKVNSFEDFLSQFRGDWPDTQSVALDLDIIEKKSAPGIRVFTSDSPRIHRKIYEYLNWQQEQLKKQIEYDSSLELSRLEKFGAKILDMARSGQGENALEVLALEEGSAFLGERMKELDRVGEKIAMASFATKGKEESMRILMQTLLSEYFSRLTPESKKLIVSSYFGSDLLANDLQKFEIMVQNSGPQLQKLLQIVARQGGLQPEMLEVFRRLESSVRPVPWHQVQEILEKEKSHFEFTYFERAPLGVGTMAQVHRAKIKINGKVKDVVVRFIKPGIAERIEEDRKILTSVAVILDADPEFRKTGAPKLGPIVQDITRTVLAELSQHDTIQRQVFAKPRYDKDIMLETKDYKNALEIRVPKVYLGPANSQLMVQEMVFGKKLDKEVNTYLENIPELKRVLVEEISKVWAQEVLFGDGFYHSDLHQGNFLVQTTDPQIRVNILDYGMGGVLSRDLQKQVTVLGVGTEILNSDLIARAFWNMSEKSDNTITQDRFHHLVRERVESILAGNEARPSLEIWTAWAMDSGLKLPYDFINLNRGIVIINKMLKESGSPLTITTLMKLMARKNPFMVYRRLILEEKISHRDLIKLGWSELKEILRFDSSLTLKPEAMSCQSVFL